MRNVILISLDTLRYDCIGLCADKVHLKAYGAANRLRTPNLDEFFRESLYLTEARTPAPYTTSAHASVMTGLYPGHHGLRPFYKWGLADGVGTLAEELKSRGYGTVAVQERGEETALKTGSGVLRGFDKYFPEERAACAYCASLGRPVLLFIHTFDVHSPYCWSHVPEVSAHDEDRLSAQRWLCSLLGIWPPADDSIDEQKKFIFRVSQNSRRVLGGRGAAKLWLEWYVRGVNWFDRVRWPRIVRTLKEAGLYDRSLIVVFADHGEAALPDFNRLPLTHMDSILEDVLRVPLALRAPDLEPGQDRREACLIDVAPTVMAYLGMEPTLVGLAGHTDGVSLLGRAQASSEPRPLFAEAWRTHHRAAPGERKGADWWREQVHDPTEPYQACVRRAELKLLWHPGAPDLWRFMAPTARLKARLLGINRHVRYVRGRLTPALKRVTPTFLVTLSQRISALAKAVIKGRRSWAGAGQPDAPTGKPGWRRAPMFGFDLAHDPLEMNPLRLNPDAPGEPWARMLQQLKEYWEDSVAGPPIELERAKGQKVMQHLRDLGYVD